MSKVNRQIQANTFQKGMMLDASDMIMPNDTVRFGQNLRLVNRSGSSYVASNLEGTDVAFTITPGYEVIASEEYNGVLYLVSWSSVNGGTIELGSYPSPNYSNPGNPSQGSLEYRPLNNLDGGSFRTNQFGTPSKPVVQKLEIQPDFDESVNLCFTIKDSKPRIVNSKFVASENGTLFSIVPDRSGEASSNTYSDASVEKETSLILFSTQILKINFKGITGGGRLKPGNYQYVFYYMTEDFNRTSVIGQSSICQVAVGSTIDTIRGGNQNEDTTKRVELTLSNVDTDFRYLKVYVVYSSGIDGLQKQYLELVQPIPISGRSSFDFSHTGFEEMIETSLDEVNIDYASIESAAASTQVGGYYFIGNIKQRTFDFTTLKSKALSLLSPIYAERSIPASVGYTDPANVYNYLGYMSFETYPFGIVFILPDGSLSPVLPMGSVDIIGVSPGQRGDAINSKLAGVLTGIVRFPRPNERVIYDPENNNIIIKHLRIDIKSLLADTYVQENTIGFFFVRGERRPNALCQGVMIPTVKAPTVETSLIESPSSTYYVSNKSSINDINQFKHLINLDGLIECYADTFLNASVLDGDGSFDASVGYMINTFSNNTNPSAAAPVNIFYSNSADSWARHWAFLTGDAFVNEPEMVSLLQRDTMGLYQIAKPRFNVRALLEKTQFNTNMGVHYDMVDFGSNYDYLYNTLTLKTIKKTRFVPHSSFATGSDFISRIRTTIPTKGSSPTFSHIYNCHQFFDSYFGIEIDENAVNNDNDFEIDPENPIGGNTRPGRGAVDNDRVASAYYDNFNQNVPAGFLVNIYPQNVILTHSQLYPSVDNIVYFQIGQRYAWSEFNATLPNVFIDVFGGDNYISKVSRKLNRPPETVSTTPEGTNYWKRWNIDSGIILSWWQESKYNLHLRMPNQFDASEPEKRSFFPHRDSGDPIAYRKYRLPETSAYSPGYSEILTAKSFFAVSETNVLLRSRFMSRIYHSEKHVPNAYRNGYRSFTETSFRDYDPGMGSIVALFNHRGQLLVVFEHGIGIAPIEQRIETGSDSAGSIFVEPSGVLPPTLMYLSREIGCQDTMSLVQTPGSVYGVDRSKDKIWRVDNGLKVISDESVASWIIDNPAINPRSGYDFENNEVIFNTNNWCLCYTEGLEKFTSFYTYTDAHAFARRNKEIYSFVGSTAHKHNSASNFQIYGSDQEVIIEFVVNKDLGVAKVYDYINIVSNEVPPSKIEFYSYNQDVVISPTIEVSNLNQYTRVDAGTDQFTQEDRIAYRDKKFVVQIPYRQDYNSGSSSDRWGVEGRMRDKYMIVRLTYVTDKPLELASVLNFYRYSPS